MPSPQEAGAWSSSSETNGSPSFAERFGQAPLFWHGGVVVGAATFAGRNKDRWEKSIDKLLERFGSRRRLTGFHDRTTSEINNAKAHSRFAERITL
jgi:hypothetical protein